MKAQLILPMLCGMASTASATEKPQNVVIILTDDLGFSDIGCFGGEIETPNLDKMAEQGIKMTQLYNSARSCPSRACLLTGLYPHQVGVGGMANAKIAIDPKKPVGYAGFRTDNNVTIAELMKEAGYYTAMSGKRHLGVQLWTIRRIQLILEHKALFKITGRSTRTEVRRYLLCHQRDYRLRHRLCPEGARATEALIPVSGLQCAALPPACTQRTH